MLEQSTPQIWFYSIPVPHIRCFIPPEIPLEYYRFGISLEYNRSGFFFFLLKQFLWLNIRYKILSSLIMLRLRLKHFQVSLSTHITDLTRNTHPRGFQLLTDLLLYSFFFAKSKFPYQQFSTTTAVDLRQPTN